MTKRTLPYLIAVLALCSAAPSFGQERTRDAVQPSDCDEVTALQGDCPSQRSAAAGTADSGSASVATSGGPNVSFQTSDETFNSIMNNIGNNPNACISQDDYDYLQEYEQEHPEMADSIDQNWISPQLCE